MQTNEFILFYFVDEQISISTSPSASLFLGSLNEQITQPTNLTTSVLPTSTSGLPEEKRKQLTTGQTNGNHLHPASAENVTQNNISSNTSQNMIKDTEETTLGVYITEAENSEFVYENSTAGGSNDSQALPLHSDANFISATGANIMMNSTMENETMINEVTPIMDIANLPSESFQNITLQGITSQMPNIANSTSSHFGINVTRSDVADYITNNTTIEDINVTLLNSTTNYFVLSSDNLTSTAVRENTTGPSVTSEEALRSFDTGEFHVTTASIPSGQSFVTDNSSVSSTETENETTASFSTRLNGLTTVTNESVDIVVEVTTEGSWDASTGGTTDDLSGGTIISDNQATSKSDAVAVAIGVIIGLLLIAALIIAFMLIRRRIIYG